MGLDTVELIIEIETKFRVSIPDREAEKMFTLEKVSDWLFLNIETKLPSKDLKNDFLAKFNQVFKEFTWIKNRVVS